MQPLIDADVLVYEVGFACETAWTGPGYPSFDFAADMLDSRISNICAVVGATAPPILYLTGKGNFRYDIAKRQPYKERAGNKPYHYYNLQAYIKAKYDTKVSEGMEADDLIAIEQTRREEILGGNPLYSGPTKPSIICTRDKDLLSVPGWHYGWECHNQPSYGPELVDEFGKITLQTKVDSKGRKTNKIVGTGLMFFYAQCLTGDPVDTVPGIPGTGAAKAFKILEGSVDSKDALKRVYGAYRASYGPLNAYREMLEQGRLLHMTRKLKEDGTPYLWGQTT